MSHSHSPPKKSSGWFFIGILLLLLAAAVAVKILLGLTAGGPAEDAARVEERGAARLELEAANTQRLESYAWVDREAGSVQIPISLAMEITVAHLQGSQPTVAGPVDPAAVAPTETPAEMSVETPVDPAAASADSAVEVEVLVEEVPSASGNGPATETPAPEPANSQANP